MDRAEAKAAKEGRSQVEPVGEIPEVLREIPAPGNRYRGGRGKHVLVKIVVLTTSAILVVGGAFVGGMAVARAIARPPQMAITDQDALRYGLTDYPVAAAAAFAERYATLCLNIPQDAAASTARLEQLRAITTTGVTPGCGLGAQSSTTTVTYATFAGVRGTVEGRDSARYIGVQVSLSDGRLLDLSVPVWTDPAAPGTAFMVVGSLGNNPLPGAAKLEAITSPRNDAQLSQELKSGLFTEFFEAWGTSNQTVLSRFATDDATDAVMLGLSGALGVPEVGQVITPVPEGSSGTYVWTDGDSTLARVQVTWTLPGMKTGMTMSYRMEIIKNGTQWGVKSISGASPDSSGSMAPDESKAVPQPLTPEEPIPPSEEPPPVEEIPPPA